MGRTCPTLPTLEKRVKESEKPKTPYVEVVKRLNLLFTCETDGRFTENSVDWGLDVTGWSWSSRFADLDNDQCQDVYVVNGVNIKKEWASNKFLRNIEGQHFVDQTEKAGLTSHLTAGAFSFLDIDSDGDQDIITVPFDVLPIFHLNQMDSGNSIDIELWDYIGNHFGIGTKVIIHYGPEDSLKQIRELKTSGGYLSFDAPTLHFGLAEFGNVSTIEVKWSTGETQVIKGDFPVGPTYRLTRVGPENFKVVRN